ncbi:MAG: glycosyl hydrolase [Dysgonomonas sp.]
MKNKLKRLSLIVATCGCIQLIYGQTNEVTAISANEFLNSLGVNSAIDSRGENIDKTIECIKYLGVRWIRSGYEDETTMDNYKRLRNEAGARLSYGLLSGGNDIERLIDRAKKIAAFDALLAIEGNNEPNNWGIKYQGEEGGKQNSWLPVAKLQRDLYAAVKNDPILKKYPVWSISENGAQTDNVGLQYLTIPEDAGTLMPAGTKFADYANCHNYITHPAWSGLHDNQTWLSAAPGKSCPVDGLHGNYGVTWGKKFKGYSEQEQIDLPKVTTETGTVIDNTITEEIQARLYMSLYLAQFKQGWKHTAIYLLRDRSDEGGNQTFGFYRKDYQPRKSAHYLHNLTTILADKKTIKSPGKLSYMIPDQPNTVHDLLLQTSDGTFKLVIWGERYTGGEDKVQVKLGKKFKTIKIYDPVIGAEPIDNLSDTDIVFLIMTNHPYIIEFRK